MKAPMIVVLLIATFLLQGCVTYIPDQMPAIQHIPTSAYDEAIYAGCVRAMARINLHLGLTDELSMNWIYNYCAEIVKSFDEDRIQPTILSGT